MGFYMWEMLELFMGFVLFILGICFFKNPIMVVHSTEIELRNGFGMLLRKIKYQPHEIRFEGFNLFVANRQLPISRLTAHKKDLIILKSYFEKLTKTI
jgi:hypothetical protein